MFCPETVVFQSYKHPLMIVRHEGADYHKGAPWRVKLNPLRYELCLRYKAFGGRRNYYFNRKARAYRFVSHLWFRIRHGDPDKYFARYRRDQDHK